MLPQEPQGLHVDVKDPVLLGPQIELVPASDQLFKGLNGSETA